MTRMPAERPGDECASLDKDGHVSRDTDPPVLTRHYRGDDQAKAETGFVQVDLWPYLYRPHAHYPVEHSQRMGQPRDQAM
jgi:hypothetical protein